MLEKGRVALLFDGFDELAQRVSFESATDHFDTLLQAAAGQAKVVVTSRTHHFESDKQVQTTLLPRAEPIAGLRLCHLRPFDEALDAAELSVCFRNPWPSPRRGRQEVAKWRQPREAITTSVPSPRRGRQDLARRRKPLVWKR